MPRPSHPTILSRLAEALAGLVDGALDALRPQPQPIPVRVRARRGR